MKKSFKKFTINIHQRFFIKLFILFVTVVLLDLIIGNLLSIFYFKQKSGFQYRTTYSIEKTTADLLMFGSSTANHNYDPRIFKKRLNISSYNAGRDGLSLFYDYAVFKGVLKRYSPKIVILDFGPEEFVKDGGKSYDRLSCLLPYYRSHPEIRSIIDLKSPYEKFKVLSHIYPYNSSIFSIAIGNVELNKKRIADGGDSSGYVPLTEVWDQPINDTDTYVRYESDSNKIKIFEYFIRDCVAAKIELYIVCSPLFIKPEYISNSVVLGKKIADKYHVQFFDYSKDTMFLNHPRLFADFEHLNIEGSKEFSEKVTEKIVATIFIPKKK